MMPSRSFPLAALFLVLVGTEAAAQTAAEKDKVDTPADSGKSVAAEKSLAPLVRIEPVVVDSLTARVCVVTEKRSGGFTDVKLRVDGIPQGQPKRDCVRGLGDSQESWVFNVDVVPGTTYHLEAVASATDTTVTETAVDTVVAPSPLLRNAKLHILTIGIDLYGGSVEQLTFAELDARAFADSLRTWAESLFGSKNILVRPLYGPAATRKAILRELIALRQTVDSSDTFVFFYAGHGVVLHDTEFWLAGAEVDTLTSELVLESHGIKGSDLAERIELIGTKNKLVILDACNSEAVTGAFAIAKGRIGSLFASNSSDRTGVFASALRSQPSTEYRTGGHGLFTYALLSHPKEGRRELLYTRRFATRIEEEMGLLRKGVNVAQQASVDDHAKPDFPLIIRTQ